MSWAEVSNTQLPLYTIWTEHHFPESPDDLPESLSGLLKVLFHGLTKIILNPLSESQILTLLLG